MPRAALRQPAAAPGEPRLRHEAAVIAQAEADLDAGRGIPEVALEAWLEALEADPATPPPLPEAPPAAR